MSGIEQSPQSACQGCGQTTDQVGQADSVGAAPGDELELDHPVEFGHRLVAILPVTVQTHDLVFEFVDHQDVGSHRALGAAVALQFEPCVDVIDVPQTVFVLIPLAAFNLVVGLLSLGLLRLHRGANQGDVLVHPRTNPALELPLGDLVDLGSPLSGVEVSGRKRHDHPVDRDKLSAGALLVVVVPEFEVLRTAQRQLGQELLLLVAELFDLLRQLPVHVVALALGLLNLLLVHLTHDLGPHGTVRREQFLDGSGGKVHAGFCHHRVNHLGGAHEGSPARSVLAHAGALETFFVLLVALLTGTLVHLDKFDVPQSNG